MGAEQPLCRNEADLRKTILDLLREEDPGRLEELWSVADRTRKAFVGDAVHLRGLVEISNRCGRQCAYCGLRAGNLTLERFRMSEEEILDCAREADRQGMGTVVLQGGEDYGLPAEWIASIIRRIKSETPLAVTLSLGERPQEELETWREAGADRYFLRFETSDESLYRAIHPLLPDRPVHRVEMLQRLQALGYQTGSGIMIGIPGQGYESIAEDILLCRRLDLDMIGVGPWVPHPQTPLGSGRLKMTVGPGGQVPNSELMTYKVIALMRLCCPEANIPATTALATLDPDRGYELALGRGANVIMPNMASMEYRKRYEIYPKQDFLSRTGSTVQNIKTRIRSIGRTVGTGPGARVAGSLKRDVFPPAADELNTHAQCWS